jgi:hypothetical protein
MKILKQGESRLEYGQDGEPYFVVGECVWHIDQFTVHKFDPPLHGYYASTHISNTGGIAIRIDDEQEVVHYAIVT